MSIVQYGSVNTAALYTPDLYVQVVPPQNYFINGVPTNVLGIVGTSSYGPVNTPVTIGSPGQYTANFGPIQNRKYDMGTPLMTASQQGANNFVCVRVTDGTDTKAIGTVQGALSLAASYTGSFGNNITITFASGSAASTTAVLVSVPGFVSEIFNNIPGTGASLWTNVANALTTGLSATRGPSAWLTATATGLTLAPSYAATTMAGGTDGVSSVSATTLLGADQTTSSMRTGMYALRNQGASVGVLSDCDTSSVWTSVAGFGLSEGIYMIVTGPVTDATANVSATSATPYIKGTAGLDSYAVKVLYGDWLYWWDAVNNVTRVVSPQGFAAGRLVNLTPNQSSLNKQLYGIIGSVRSGLNPSQNTVYSPAELQVLGQAGVDLITNPAPGGKYWAVRFGHNSSSNASTNGDNYVRMTNFLATTFNAAMGKYIGQNITPSLFNRISATLNAFLEVVLNQGMLSLTTSATGKLQLPYSVVCGPANNPFTLTSLNTVQAAVQVQYQAINEKFIINLEGGQTVTVNRVPASLS